jgi:hypothetical protein
MRTNNGGWMLSTFLCASLATPGVVAAWASEPGGAAHPREPELALPDHPSLVCPTTCTSDAECQPCGDGSICVGKGICLIAE